MTTTTGQTAGFMERLAAGSVICAEGYLFELERRGYLQAGAFVPEVVLAHPEEVTALHREFVHAGSDVVEAFTYYGHREKLRPIGKEDLLEPLNRTALELASAVARETGTLLAGTICNTNVFTPDDDDARRIVRSIFDEQVAWAAEAGVDVIVAETLDWTDEALLALESIRAAGLASVVTLAVHRQGTMRDGRSAAEVCRVLADAGADVVGLNCARGPATMLPLLAEVVLAVDVPVAALPVPYRTTAEQPTFQSLHDAHYHGQPTGRPFPTGLDPFTCTRYEIGDFTRQAHDMGVRYLGVCCGAGPHHVRALAEAVGKAPPASRYSPDMSKHAFLGSHDRLAKVQKEYAPKL
ncbi:MAG: homocysteine S-methyltransferase family protein [Ilumatobacteraceae bacterium]